MKKTRLLLLASLMCVSAFSGCSKKKTDSSVTASSSDGNAVSESVTKSENLSENNETSSGTKEKTLEDEYADLVKAYSKYNHFDKAYTIKSKSVSKGEDVKVIKGEKTSYPFSDTYLETISYSPNKIYYCADNSISDDPYTSDYIYEITSDGEYEYDKTSDEETGYKYKLSSGHTAIAAELNYSSLSDSFLPVDNEGELFKSFDDYEGYARKKAELFIKYDLYYRYNRFFSLPKYELTEYSEDSEICDEENEHFAKLTYSFTFVNSNGTAATDYLCGVKESEYVYTNTLKIYYDESGFYGVKDHYTHTVKGSDGVNSFNYSYDDEYECSITEGYDEASCPSKVDNYTEQNYYCSMEVVTPQGFHCGSYYNDGSGVNVNKDDLLYASSGYEFSDVYSDKEMTKKVTFPVTLETYDQTYYAVPVATDAKNALVITCFQGRSSEDDDYSTLKGNNGGSSWSPTPIDANGQVDLSANHSYVSSGVTSYYSIDSIEVVYTNDPNENVTSGKKINVNHNYYYYVVVNGTLITE